MRQTTAMHVNILFKFVCVCTAKNSMLLAVVLPDVAAVEYRRRMHKKLFARNACMHANALGETLHRDGGAEKRSSAMVHAVLKCYLNTLALRYTGYRNIAASRYLSKT